MPALSAGEPGSDVPDEDAVGRAEPEGAGNPGCHVLITVEPV